MAEDSVLGEREGGVEKGRTVEFPQSPKEDPERGIRP